MKNIVKTTIALSALCFSMPFYGEGLCLLDDKISSVEASRDTFLVKGCITDGMNGEALYGVRVSVYGGKQVAITDEQGAFLLKIEKMPVTLLVSTIGYRSSYVPLNKVEEVNVALHRQLSEDEGTGLIVSELYTPSVQGSGSDEVDVNVTTRLLGSIYGNIHSGTEANGSATFIRGIHSLNASSQPLYVVDGVMWQSSDYGSSIFNGYSHSPLSLLSPDDIAEIKIMKNGTALYGSKGANGVILIRTKRATNMATQIEAYATVGFSMKPKTMPVMDADNYRVYLSDMVAGYYKDPNQIDGLKFLNNDPSKSYYWENHAHTDWNDLITQKGVKQNYGISIRGGDERALYAFSLGYANRQGSIKETGMDRINMRINSDINLTDHLKTRFDFAFAQVNRDAFDDGMVELSSPTYMAMIKAPFYSSYRLDAQGNRLSRLSDVDELNVGNPLAVIENSDNGIKQYRFNVTLNPTYTFNNHWKVGALFNYSWDKIKENAFLPDYGVASMELVNEQGEVYGTAQNRVRTMMSSQKSFEAGLFGIYTPFHDAVKQLQVEGGYKFYHDSFKSAYGEGYNTGSDNITILQNTVDATRSITGGNESWRSVAWYATADFSYLYRYYLSAGLTLDTSSRFGKGASGTLSMCGLSWGVFPSVEAAWAMSSEKWMRRLHRSIDLLKWKVGYNVAGNDNLPNGATRAYFGSVGYMGQGYGLRLENIANPELKWETTRTFNAGIELSMLNRRLQLDVDWYTAKTSDVLMPNELDEVAGLRSYWSNNGSLRNTGVEIVIKTRPVYYKNFVLDAGLMLGHYRNKITDIAGGEMITDVLGGQVLNRKGEAAGLFYGYKYEGVFSTREAADAANLSVRTENGSYRKFEAGDACFADLYKDGVIDDKDRTVIGDPNPDLYGNFSLTAQYKRFTLDALFTFSCGGDVYNAYRANLEAGSQLYNQTRALENRWMVDGQTTDVPRATYGDPMGNSRFSSRWIEDGSYLRFQTLSLSYTLPVKSDYLNKIRVFATVNNLFTLTKYLGADPVFQMGSTTLLRGIDGGLTAASRSFLLGFKINL